MKSLFTTITKHMIVAALVLVGGAYIFAQSTFTYPPAGTVPPNGNVAAPINAGPSLQTKSGGLFLNTDASPLSTGLKAFGRTLLYPNFAGDVALQVGTTTGGLTGKIQIIDGNQGAGKVLTSDANGVATWSASASGGGRISFGPYTSQNLTDHGTVSTTTLAGISPGALGVIGFIKSSTTCTDLSDAWSIYTADPNSTLVAQVGARTGASEEVTAQDFQVFIPLNSAGQFKYITQGTCSGVLKIVAQILP